MSFAEPWWSGSYQVNGTGVPVATTKWIAQPIVDGLDGPVVLSRWWELEWFASEMYATDHSFLLGLLSSSVTLITPAQDDPATFQTYASAILESLRYDGQYGSKVSNVFVTFRVFV